MTNYKRLNYNIVVFGARDVGKSAVAMQFAEGHFLTSEEPMIEETYKRVLAIDNENVQLDIVDVPGQDDHAAIRAAYIRRGHGFVIVYAIDDRASFEAVEVVHRELLWTREHATYVPVVICGNKCDLADKRVVSQVEGKELAGRLHAKFFETSALANICIEDAFRALARDIRQFVGPTSQVSETNESKSWWKRGRRGHRGCAPS